MSNSIHFLFLVRDKKNLGHEENKKNKLANYIYFILFPLLVKVSKTGLKKGIANMIEIFTKV